MEWKEKNYLLHLAGGGKVPGTAVIDLLRLEQQRGVRVQGAAGVKVMGTKV
jgi:hypothetical protein